MKRKATIMALLLTISVLCQAQKQNKIPDNIAALIPGYTGNNQSVTLFVPVTVPATKQLSVKQPESVTFQPSLVPLTTSTTYRIVKYDSYGNSSVRMYTIQH